MLPRELSGLVGMRYLAPLVRSSMILGGTRVGLRRGDGCFHSGGVGRRFMSYWREEAADPAGWLCDWLADRYGDCRVFKKR
jgi:hypothetical protein